MRVLIVEDDDDSRRVFAKVLQVLGYAVKEAGSGSEALKVVAEFDPEAIVSDLSMPHMDGYQLAKEVLAIAPHRRPLLIAVSGVGESGSEKAGEAGFDYFLSKPINSEQLKRILDAHGTTD